MVAKKKAVKKKAKPRATRAPSATALATAALKRAQTRSTMDEVKSRYAAKYGRAPTEAMARSIMAAIAAGIPIDATFRDPDPLVVAPATQTQVPLVALNSGPMGQARVVPAALVPQVGPAQGQAPNAVDMMLRQRNAQRRIAAIQNQFLAANEPNVPAANRRIAAIQRQFTAPGATEVIQDAPVRQGPTSRERAEAAFNTLLSRRTGLVQGQDEPVLQRTRAPMTADRAAAANRRIAAIQNQFLAPGALAPLVSEQSEAIRGRPAPPRADPAAVAAAREIARLENLNYILPPALAVAGQDAPIRQGATNRERAEAAFNQLLARRTGLVSEQSEAIRGAPARTPGALVSEQSEAIRGRPATQPPVLVLDPVSANTGYSTARLQERDNELTVLRESREAAVRAMQEQAREQERARERQERPNPRKRKSERTEEDIIRIMEGLNIEAVPDPVPVPVPPQLPPRPPTQADREAAFREDIRARRNRPPPPPVDERAEFQARKAAHEAGLQAARERLAADAAAAYQQQRAARNPPAETGDVSMNFGPDPREAVLPAEGEVGTFDDLGEGSKIQSIAFPIGEWSSASALRWLRSHGFVPQKKGEAKANYLRYRIRAPRFSNYFTRALQSKGRKIHLIIGV